MNAVFIHIPRTAGRFIIATLGLERLIYRRKAIELFRQKGRVTFGHQDYAKLVRRSVVNREFDKSAFKFTFCRNPFDRVVSHYCHARKNHSDILSRDVSFEEFVLNLEKFNVPRRGKKGAKKTFRPQRCSIRQVKVDFIGRFENLHDDIQKVADIIGVKIQKVRPVGTTRHKPYQTYYTEQLEQKIREFYKEDYEFFGYDNHLFHRE